MPIAQRFRFRWMGGVLVLAALGVLIDVGGVARAAPSPDDVPTAEINVTHLTVGTNLTLSGSGCMDASTGSAAGFLIGAGLVSAEGEPLIGWGLIIPATPVEADGTFSVSVEIVDPVSTGDFGLLPLCFSGAPSAETSPYELDPIPITMVSPPIQDLIVTDEVVSFADPCGDRTSSVGIYPGAVLHPSSGKPIPLGQADPSHGVVSLDVPDSVEPGAYELEATCTRRRVDRPDVIQRSPLQWPGDSAAVPAVPHSGEPSLTG